MKRLLIFLFLTSVAVYAFSTAIVIRPGVTLENVNNKYYIHFVMPDYDVVTDTFTVEHINNTPLPNNQLAHAEDVEYYYSRIKPKQPDAFDYLSEDGRPELPFYSLNFALPPNNTFYTVFVDEDKTQTETIILPYDYTPSQAGNYFDNGDIHFDPVYYNNYNDTWYWDNYKDTISYYRHVKGINFSIFPCHYEPSTQSLTIVTEAYFEIEYDGLDLAIPYLEDMLDEDRSIYFFFDNFIGFPEPYWEINDHYLIITTDEWGSDNALLDFKDHKESLGYIVSIETFSDPYNTPENIRACIKTYYETCNTKFVLLVGDVQGGDVLPFSSGIAEDEDNPPTDMYYSCLSKEDTCDQWTDLNPSVFIGRWPIPHGASNLLRNIVDKTIASDLHLWEGLHSYETSKIALFAGKDSNYIYLNNYFYHDCSYIYKNIVQEYSYYSGDIIDGRNLSTNFMTMKNYMECSDEPSWMFIYIGHGSWNWIASPYCWLDYQIGNIATSTLEFQPFGFGFACQIGNIFKVNNFARAWVTSADGGPSFLGATTNSTNICNRYFSRTMFNQLKNKPYMTIGEFVGNGKAKYYNANPVVWRRREAKKYVLYGDPSLYLFGLRFNEPYNMPSVQAPKNKDEYVDDFQFVNIFSMTGQLMCTSYTSQPDLVSLPSGIYTMVYYYKEHKVTKKIVLP